MRGTQAGMLESVPRYPLIRCGAWAPRRSLKQDRAAESGRGASPLG